METRASLPPTPELVDTLLLHLHPHPLFLQDSSILINQCSSITTNPPHTTCSITTPSEQGEDIYDIPPLTMDLEEILEGQEVLIPWE
jgi:hypothetical protein